MTKRRKNHKNSELQIGGQDHQLISKSKTKQVNRFDSSHAPTPMAALAVAALGVYFMALGLKILPIPLHALHAPHWMLTAIGIAVLFSGIAVELQCLQLVKSWHYKIVIAIIVLAMLTPFAWLVFGDSNLSMFFRIAFASPFAIILLLLLPGGKTRIIANPDGKPISELLKERRSENSSTLHERKLKKESNGTDEISKEMLNRAEKPELD